VREEKTKKFVDRKRRKIYGRTMNEEKMKFDEASRR
jgi:hypothetical protein